VPDSEVQQPAATPEPAATVTNAPPTANGATEAATPSWITELDKLDPKELRRHPRIAGIIGSEIQTAIERANQKRDEDDAQKNAELAHAQARELAQTDVVTFAEKWLSEDEQKEVRKRLDSVESTTREKFAKNIGRGYNSLPEWAELTPDEIGQITSKVQGLPEDDVLPTFNATALDVVARKRAAKMLSEWQQKELPKEREAIRKEEAARLLQGQSAPDLGRGSSGPGGVQRIVQMSDAEFEKQWANDLSKRKR
jgi:hypothetical protein